MKFIDAYSTPVTGARRNRKKNLFNTLIPHAGIVLLLLSTTGNVQAGSASWSGQLNSNWNVFQNWSPQTVPNGPSDIATLGGTFNRTVYLSANVQVNAITFPKPFSPSAVNYGITVNPGFSFGISGNGITNNSGKVQ